MTETTTNKKYERLAIGLLFGLGFLAMMGITVLAINHIANWFQHNTLRIQSPVVFTTQRVIVIEPIKTPDVVVEKEVIIGDEVDKIDTPVEEMILARWGENYPQAKAVFMAESGLKCDAYNINTNGTVDVGVAQINSVNWELEENFGLAEAVDCEKNLDLAYRLWDRGDGLEDDGKGNFSAWVAYTNKSWVAHLD